VDSFPFWLVGFALVLVAPWAVSLLVTSVERRVRRRTAEVLGPLAGTKREPGAGDPGEP